MKKTSFLVLLALFSVLFVTLFFSPVSADEEIEIEEEKVFEVERSIETIDTNRPLLVADYESDLNDLTKQLVDQNINIKSIKKEILV